MGIVAIPGYWDDNGTYTDTYTRFDGRLTWLALPDIDLSCLVVARFRLNPTASCLFGGLGGCCRFNLALRLILADMLRSPTDARLT